MPKSIPVTVKASEVFLDATITVPVRFVVDWRYRVGIWLLKAACWVLRSNLKLEHGSDARP